MACFVPKRRNSREISRNRRAAFFWKWDFPSEKTRKSAAHAAKFDFILPAFWQTEARKGFGPLALCNEFGSD